MVDSAEVVKILNEKFICVRLTHRSDSYGGYDASRAPSLWKFGLAADRAKDPDPSAITRRGFHKFTGLT